MESPANLEYLVKVSYMEIYMVRIFRLCCRRDGLTACKGTHSRLTSTYMVGSPLLTCTCTDVPLVVAQNDNLPIHEDKTRGVYIKNLSDYYVGSADEVYEIMRQGGLARVTTSTSRSWPCNYKRMLT